MPRDQKTGPDQTFKHYLQYPIISTNSSNIPPHPLSIQELAITSQVDLDMEVLDTPNFSSHGSPLYVINTSFDHNHTFNKKLGFPPKDKKCYHYTQKERTHVVLAKSAHP